MAVAIIILAVLSVFAVGIAELVFMPVMHSPISIRARSLE